jgi:hypothetical protein
MEKWMVTEYTLVEGITQLEKVVYIGCKTCGNFEYRKVLR